MKILLGDFNAKLGSEDTFKPTIGNESLHLQFYKYTRTSPDGKTHNQIDHAFIDYR
jgi:hypothetical protein